MIDFEVGEKWQRILSQLEKQFGKKPDLNAVLYLIGLRELGALRTEFSKEEKVKLMHIAVCRLLSFSGYYELEGVDEKGWPSWKLMRPLPHSDIFQQEYFLKFHIVEYFESEEILLP